MDKEALFVDYILLKLENKSAKFDFICKKRLDWIISILKKNDVQNKLDSLAVQSFPDVESVTSEKIMMLGLVMISTEFIDEKTFLSSSKQYGWAHLVLFVNFIFRLRLLYPSKKTFLRFVAIKTLHCYCSDWIRKNLWTTDNTVNIFLALVFSSCLLYTVYQLIKIVKL